MWPCTLLVCQLSYLCDGVDVVWWYLSKGVKDEVGFEGCYCDRASYYLMEKDDWKREDGRRRIEEGGLKKDGRGGIEKKEV